ncbi:MAG: hypothetical protein PHE06_00265 [Lachnospiraceae bacterium]|nr:hypothetical protein [Lachnospiraceae bacterium]
MSGIRTILGDIAAEEFGICDFHDHLIRSYGPEINANIWYLMDDIEAAEMELNDWLMAGGKSMVCMDPIGCGRDVPKMKRIADKFQGRANIIMSTGFHKGSLYDNRGHWSWICPQKEVVEMVVKEVTEGMDIYSYAGPIVKRGEAKAGIIKAGTGLRQITSFEKNLLTIAAKAQKECGAPVSVHTDMGTMGVEAAGILKEEGADLEKCVICHTNKINDRYYHKKMLDLGINLSFEGPDRHEWLTDVELAENMRWLIEQGYEKQIVLSMDAGRTTLQKGYMKKEEKIAHGISYLLTDFIPLMKTIGISQSAIDQMLIYNPARILTIK